MRGQLKDLDTEDVTAFSDSDFEEESADSEETNSTTERNTGNVKPDGDYKTSKLVKSRFERVTSRHPFI